MESRANTKALKLQDIPAQIPKYLTNEDFGGRADDPGTEEAESTEGRIEIPWADDSSVAGETNSDLADDEVAYNAFEKYLSKVVASEDFGELVKSGRPPLTKTLVTKLSAG